MAQFVQLTANIEVANAVPRIVKWRATHAQDFDTELPPYLIVKIQTFGAGVGESNPYSDVKTLCIRDGNALSTCLRVKETPQRMDDQLEVFDQVIGGTPYTTLSALYAANVSGGGTNAKRLQALQGGMVAAGAVSVAFAGT
jgi:hypothetical protein